MIETKSVRVIRRLPGGTILRLGQAVRTSQGWRFLPHVAGRRPSRRAHETLEACLPRWVGYPDACETQVVEEENR